MSDSLSILLGAVLLLVTFSQFMLWWVVVWSRRGYTKVERKYGKNYANNLSINTLYRIGNPLINEDI